MKLVILMAWIFLLIVAVSIANAHSWYDPACCSDNDCAPDNRVKEVRGGFRVPTGEVVPYGDKRIRPSLDKQFHWCHFQTHTYCVYVPGGVS